MFASYAEDPQRSVGETGDLAEYLDTLCRVTLAEQPDVEQVMRLQDLDAQFGAVTFRRAESHKATVYEAAPMMSTVLKLSRLALFTRGTVEYDDQLAREYPKTRGMTKGFDHLNYATPEARRAAARSALIGIGTLLPVSGVYGTEDTQASMAAVRDALETLSQGEARGNDRKAFVADALKEIGDNLFYYYVRITNGKLEDTPASPELAEANIRAAWKVTGKPYLFVRHAAARLSALSVLGRTTDPALKYR